ncbi:MAG: beta-propeller fold lactonase family protein [Pseudolabrys sp.]
MLPDRSNKFVYAATLGANQVLQFTFDSKSGKLTANEPASVSPEAGHGPRHLAFSSDNKYLYVLNELSGHVTQYVIDASKGTLTLVDSVSSVPAEAGLAWGAPPAPVGAAPASASAAKDEKPKVWAADIQVTPDGKFLYTTERTTNKIALFTVAPGTGKLAYVTNFATEAQPRGIRIDPTGQYLVASGEKSDRVSVYKIDQSTGKLSEPTRHPVGNGANWVEIVELK